LGLAATPATACEWHEMMAYGYGGDAPQRFSPFSRAEQGAEEPAPPAAQPADGAAQTAEVQADQAQVDANAAEREREDDAASERIDTILAARR
jgi:hypothetical protein